MLGFCCRRGRDAMILSSGAPTYAQLPTPYPFVGLAFQKKRSLVDI